MEAIYLTRQSQSQDIFLTKLTELTKLNTLTSEAFCNSVNSVNFVKSLMPFSDVENRLLVCDGGAAPASSSSGISNLKFGIPPQGRGWSGLEQLGASLVFLYSAPGSCHLVAGTRYALQETAKLILFSGRLIKRGQYKRNSKPLEKKSQSVKNQYTVNTPY